MRAIVGAAFVAVMVSLSSAQAQTWTTKVGTTGIDEARGAHADADGNIYTVGYSAIAGGGTWLTRHDKNGVQQWKKPVGFTAGYDSGLAIGFIDQFGPVVISGSLDVIHFHMATGAERWRRRLPAAGLTTPYAIAGGEHSWYAYVVGTTKGQVGGGPSNSGDDAWMVKYDGSGNVICEHGGPQLVHQADRWRDHRYAGHPDRLSDRSDPDPGRRQLGDQPHRDDHGSG